MHSWIALQQFIPVHIDHVDDLLFNSLHNAAE